MNFSITIGLSLFNSTNGTVHGVWNTSAGLDSYPSSAGFSSGNYWPNSSPRAAFDNNLTSLYISYGACNVSVSFTTCGRDTGLYLTPQWNSSLLLAFRISTGSWGIMRDPLTITIEGSNKTGSALIWGSSWILIYNGSTGLIPDPGRNARGITQKIPNNSIWFSSYRLLVTTIRGNASAVEYSEVELFF